MDMYFWVLEGAGYIQKGTWKTRRYVPKDLRTHLTVLVLKKHEDYLEKRTFEEG